MVMCPNCGNEMVDTPSRIDVCDRCCPSCGYVE